MASLKFMFALVLCIAVAAPSMVSNAAISCNTVTSGLAPCLNYLRGTGPLQANCCGGIRGLVNMARTTADRQQACGCLQQAARSIPGIKPDVAAGLPGRCNVNIPYKISTSTNCRTVR